MLRQTTERPARERAGSVWLPVGTVYLLLLVAGGCTGSVQEFIKLGDGGPRSLGQEPLILSASPDRDAEAYRGSSKELSEADWQVLERIAPRAVWRQIIDARRAFLSRKKDRPTATRPAESDKGAETPRDVPVEPLPGDRVRIFYELRHYGGTDVSSTVSGGQGRRKISFKPTDLAPIAALVTAQLAGKGEAVPIPLRNALLVTCDATAKDAILKLLGQLDSPERQVEIRARIFEVNHNFDFQYGAHALIKHIASDNKQGLASAFSAKDFVGSMVDPVVNSIPNPGAALRLMKVFTDAGLTLDVTFQALADTGLIKVVSAPRMTVRAGQTAYMLAGQELPIQSAKISNDKIISEKVEYKPVGVQLYITPQVIGPDVVKLHVITMVTAISGFAPLPALDRADASSTLTNPILDSREAETYVTIRDGQTLVIGGLRMVRTVVREQKIPGLGDIPGIEWLFKNHRSQKQVSDLYFFITPHVLN